MKMRAINKRRRAACRGLMLIMAAIFLAAPGVRAQGDAMFTQHWAVPTYYNPAACGGIDFIRIRGAAKLQWIGIDNAPRTFFGAADMPLKLGKKHRLGLGALFSQESIGLYSNILAGAQVSSLF